MPDNELIVVKQLPIIEEQLHALKAQVDERVKNALELECTDETVQTVKKARAELSKDFNSLEERRKAVKKAVLGPYEQFEAVYKECVSDAFKSADAELKNKINTTESEIKKRCEDVLRKYFWELCDVENIEFLKFENCGVKVDMASAKAKTPKKLKEQIKTFVQNVSNTVNQISEMPDAEEILVEYKETLDIGYALATVQARHRKIEQEKAAQIERAAREAAEKERFEKIRDIAPEAVQADTAAPIAAPVEVEQEKIYTCKFTVRATKTQLKALKIFMNSEGIQYE